MTDSFSHDGKFFKEAEEQDDEATCVGCAFHDAIDCSRQRMAADEVFGAPCGLRGVIYVEVMNG